MKHKIIFADVIDGLRSLPDQCIQCVVTSPPYYNMRDYNVDGQIGLESSPEEYVNKIVEVFREVRRVLRDDGSVWLNLGDSYAGGSKKLTKDLQQRINSDGDVIENDRQTTFKSVLNCLKVKDLIGIPWGVAFALRTDGWYLRSAIIWNKTNGMPEAVTDRPTSSYDHIFLLSKKAQYFYDQEAVREPQTGNACSMRTRANPKTVNRSGKHGNIRANESFIKSISQYTEIPGGRNLRNIWAIPTQPVSELHFATFPQALVEPCVKAGTSERGCCPQCGAPWRRITEKGEPLEDWKKECGADSKGEYHGTSKKHKNLMEKGQKIHSMHIKAAQNKQDLLGKRTYTGFNQRWKTSQQNASDVKRRILDGMRQKTYTWQPTCACEIKEVVPCTVLDPFLGSGTTMLVARDLNRSCVGIELNPEYNSIIRKRLRMNEQLFEEMYEVKTIGKYQTVGGS